MKVTETITKIISTIPKNDRARIVTFMQEFKRTLSLISITELNTTGKINATSLDLIEFKLFLLNMLKDKYKNKLDNWSWNQNAFTFIKNYILTEIKIENRKLMEERRLELKKYRKEGLGSWCTYHLKKKK